MKNDSLGVRAKLLRELQKMFETMPLDGEQPEKPDEKGEGGAEVEIVELGGPDQKKEC